MKIKRDNEEYLRTTVNVKKTHVTKSKKILKRRQERTRVDLWKADCHLNEMAYMQSDKLLFKR